MLYGNRFAAGAARRLLADQSYLKRRLHAWYRQQTLDVFTRLCDHWGMVMGFRPRSVKVRAIVHAGAVAAPMVRSPFMICSAWRLSQ